MGRKVKFGPLVIHISGHEKIYQINLWRLEWWVQAGHWRMT